MERGARRYRRTHPPRDRGGRRHQVMSTSADRAMAARQPRAQAWGIDGHNSHTNVCSSSARLGHFLWCGADRPSPDYANAQTILLLSSHLESGHYFNPHAQRSSNRKSGRHADRHGPAALEHVGEGDIWLRPIRERPPASSIAHILLDEELHNRDFVRKWVNWRRLFARNDLTRKRSTRSSPR